MKRVSASLQDNKVHGGEKRTKLLGEEIHRVMRKRTLVLEQKVDSCRHKRRLCMLAAQSHPSMKNIRPSKQPSLIASKTGKPSS